MIIAIFLIGLVLSVILLFMGMFVSAKLTGFSIDSADLLKVVIGTIAAGSLPAIGMLLSLIVMYVLLKRFSDGQGIIFMMICSGIITMFLGTSMMTTVSRITLQLL